MEGVNEGINHSLRALRREMKGMMEGPPIPERVVLRTVSSLRFEADRVQLPLAREFRLWANRLECFVKESHAIENR